MANEQSLNYFHGALLDEDAEKLLVNDGDYLLQHRFDKGSSSLPKLFLSVKKKQVHRFEIKRASSTTYSLNGKDFPDLKTLIEHYQKNNVQVNGETFQLKKAIPKGKFQLAHSDIRILRKIGSGAYGTVYKGILLKQKLHVAVKHIDSQKSEQGLIDMMIEARVMQLYTHRNIVKFYGYIVDRAPYLLVMELCPEGSVEDRLRVSGRTIAIFQRVDMCAQASEGLSYLHSKNCIHRDIATRNCLLSGHVLKLADFGMCRASSIYKIDLSQPQNVRWLAPEVWKTAETNFSTDIYAFGILMWEFFEIPYNSPYCTWKAITVKQKVMGGYRMPVPEKMPESLAAVMEKCWDHDPTKRPKAAEVFKELNSINQVYNDEEMENIKVKTPQTSLRAKLSQSGTVDRNNNAPKSRPRSPTQIN